MLLYFYYNKNITTHTALNSRLWLRQIT